MTVRAAIITGAARGIGRAIAERFAREGTSVGLIDVDEAGLRAAAAALGDSGAPPVAVAVADVAQTAQVAAAVAALVGALGPPAVLVNNAGIGGFGSMLAADAEDRWARALAVNLTGAFLCARHVAPHMIRGRGGAIINIASTRALASEPDGEPYAASKGGLLALTHAMALSFAPHRIRVNAISPGWIFTKGEEPGAGDHAQHPVGRVGRPEDVAAACWFLADPAASGFMTGQNLILDGGMRVKMIYE